MFVSKSIAQIRSMSLIYHLLQQTNRASDTPKITLSWKSTVSTFGVARCHSFLVRTVQWFSSTLPLAKSWTVSYDGSILWQAGGNIHLLHIVFAGYVCTSTIILLNMLIAMMNSTYSAISSLRPADWRLESLRTALWLERTLPCIQRSVFVRFPVTKTHDCDRPRWFIKLATDQVWIGSRRSCN